MGSMKIQKGQMLRRFTRLLIEWAVKELEWITDLGAMDVTRKAKFAKVFVFMIRFLSSELSEQIGIFFDLEPIGKLHPNS